MTRTTRRILTAAALTLWASAAAGGMGLVMAAMVRPDAPAVAGVVADGCWPDHFPLSRVAGGPTLVVCLHPKCPCSDATLETLENLMPRYGGVLTVYVLMALPDGAAADWQQTELIQRARRLARVNVRLDPAGRMCARLGARTSGQTFLFDGEGRLRFSGGLTPGRGEIGSTPGADRVMGVLAGRDVAEGLLTTPVFGCALCRPADKESDPARAVSGGRSVSEQSGEVAR